MSLRHVRSCSFLSILALVIAVLHRGRTIVMKSLFQFTHCVVANLAILSGETFQKAPTRTTATYSTDCMS